MIRLARPEDAGAIAKIHIETWRDSYAGLLPETVLIGLDERRETIRQRRVLNTRPGDSITLVVETERGAVVGYAEGGTARPTTLSFQAEVYTLYVRPDHQGNGLGRALLFGMFERLRRAGHDSALIWVLAANPARFFYSAMGGQRIAVRTEQLWSSNLEEEAYGWPDLARALADRGR
jgi:L-amino acid N-acyltransferase YncA